MLVIWKKANPVFKKDLDFSLLKCEMLYKNETIKNVIASKL